MKRYMKYMVVVLAAAFAAACHNDIDAPTVESGKEGALVLKVDGAQLGVQTRADDIAGLDYEYAVAHLDIMIFNDATERENMDLFYYERASVAASDGTVHLGVDINSIIPGNKYWVYVVANSTHSKELFAAIGNVKALHALAEQTYNLHLTATGLQNTPSHFLMDGVAYKGGAEPATPAAFVISEEAIKDVVTMNVTLRRAAAKVVVKLNAAEGMQFADNIEDSTPGYYMRNTPYQTLVVDDGLAPKEMDQLETTHEAMTKYYKWVRDAANNITGVEITAYVYSHAWRTDEAFTRATNLLVDIPAYYTSEVSGVEQTLPHPKNYYQVPLTKRFIFERNHYYEVVANVHTPGAKDFSEPVEILDLKYTVEPWTEHTINVGGENGPQYLTVNLDELKMYNTSVDETSLLFSSSSPVTITVADCYYIDKFGIQRSVNPTSNSVFGTTESGALRGNITVNSDIPTNNTIRYFTLVITNETGQQEVVVVEQYPLVYVVNILGHYSYRDDFKRENNEPTTIYNQGSSISSISLKSWNANTGLWSYNYGTTGGFWTSKVVRETYPGNHKQESYQGRSDIDYYGWYSGGWFDNEVKLRYSGAQDPGNARMYHVRITASSADYNLGVPRKTTDENVPFEFTDPGEDNANLVSPSFMIASRLGFVNSNGLSSADTKEERLSVSRDHCAYYVEVADNGTIYDDWRLPTAQELRIIIELQGTSSESADAIDYLLNADFYYSASGPVYNRKNDGNTSEANASSSSWAIRCIRDAY
ncbi:MAG: hypothetical protein II288_03380 [Alistipes sp.]|nr:hypothetical protein [Alistipes sp.]